MSHIALGPDMDEQREMMRAFGANLQRLRLARGLSQDQLSMLCFLTLSQISNLERGRQTPNLTVVLRLAHATGSTISDLTDGLVPPMRQPSTTAVRAAIAEQPGISTAELAGALQVPMAYIEKATRRLRADKALGRQGAGWILAPGADSTVS